MMAPEDGAARVDRAHNRSILAVNGVANRRYTFRGSTLSRAVPAIGFLLANLVACGGLPRPDRVVEPDAVGLIISVDRSDPSREIVALEGGDSVEIDIADAHDLTGPGIDADRVLLYGTTDGDIWYATLSLAETARLPDCYTIGSDAAFDEPGSVVLVFADHPEFGVRLPKRDDFVLPPSTALRSDGRYAAGVEGTSGGSFCVDADGAVFGFP